MLHWVSLHLVCQMGSAVVDTLAKTSLMQLAQNNLERFTNNAKELLRWFITIGEAHTDFLHRKGGNLWMKYFLLNSTKWIFTVFQCSYFQKKEPIWKRSFSVSCSFKVCRIYASASIGSSFKFLLWNSHMCVDKSYCLILSGFLLILRKFANQFFLSRNYEG